MLLNYLDILIKDFKTKKVSTFIKIILTSFTKNLNITKSIKVRLP